MMHIFYRISDNGNKSKFPGAKKDICLSNFLEVFTGCPITVIADKCLPETIVWLKEKSNFWNAGSGLPKIITTTIGNAPDVMSNTIELSLSLPDDYIVYMVEDDYLHLSQPLQFKTNCLQLIQEGLERFDYVTLYDHPDKYESEYNFGESCKVFKTLHSHWRQTISTTLTYATTVKTLKEDLKSWFTLRWDHIIFSSLTQKGRVLALCLPGAACHMDLAYSSGKQKSLIEPWAINLIESLLVGIIQKNNNLEILEQYKNISHLEQNTKKIAMLSVLANKC